MAHLTDLLLRRVRLGMWSPAAAGELLPALRPWVGAETGWDGGRWDAEVERYRRAAVAWTPAGIEEESA